MSPLDAAIAGIAKLPPFLQEVLAVAPANIDRRFGAELITRHLFPVSHRTLEAWPLPTRHVGGRAIVATATLLSMAYARYAAAPVVMGGRRQPSEQASA